jgi:hypothetical protein
MPLDKAQVETTEEYLDRKRKEIALLNKCLARPLYLEPPQSPNDVIEQKFQLTAALRAQHDFGNWRATETSWSHRPCVAGPFEFNYDYQRADLGVNGPSFYELDEIGAASTVYTSSGMAAITALLLASSHVWRKADLLISPGSYSETGELIQAYARHLRTVELADENLVRQQGTKLLLLDSCVPAWSFEVALCALNSSVDLLIFDTTCFAGGSAMIRRVLRLAKRSDIPVVLVRSHTKLDSLGLEYGRLGSIAFIDLESRACGSELHRLFIETQTAVRLFGGAALPDHFPPYIGNPPYRLLTRQRVASILNNGRRSSRYFRTALNGSEAELQFVHGLYVTLGSERLLDEAAARKAATEMSENLGQAGFPIRHAGSFGFDFATTEWAHDTIANGYVVRLAVPDLPTILWDDLTKAISQWWRSNQLGSG